ncbi:MAG: lactonase family protein, partial [Phycisphaerales bacterium JB037]
MRIRKVIGVAALSLLAGTASAQVAVGERLVVVSNNGNLEGSVTSFLLDSEDAPVFVNRVVTGVTDSTSNPVPGTNAYAIDISPDGRLIAVSHATAFTGQEQLDIFTVAPDGTIALLDSGSTPDSPLDLKWVNNSLLAVTQTSFGGANGVHLYRVNRDTGSLNRTDFEGVGSFLGYLAVHPSRRFIYGGDGSGNAIFVIEVDADGNLDLIQTVFTSPTYALDIDLTSDGTKLYVAGGISNGRNNVLGFDVAPNGTLSPMDTPLNISAGNSPKGVTVSADDALLYVDHGTDATVRSFFINADGSLTSTGNVFDVGLQGSHGETATLPGVVLFTDDTTAIDGIRGLYSFGVDATGSFANQNGPIVDTQGISPEHLVAWQRLCNADLTASGDPNTLTYGVPDGDADADDFFFYLDAFVAGDLGVCDFTGSSDPN